MNADPQLSAALHHWGARAVPFHDQPEQVPFLTPAWQEALRLLNQTACRYIVTHNLRDFRGTEKWGIAAVTRGGFLKTIAKTTGAH